MLCAGRVSHACKVAGVVFLVVVAATACSRKPQDAQYAGIGGAEGPVVPGTARDFSVNVGDRVHFLTDSAELTEEARAILRDQAGWLQRYSQVSILVEGHADERGTREYNIALGARRAQAVRDYLARAGVEAGRMRTISYGKERPVATCDDISCWSQNRRGVTVLNMRAGA